MRTPDTIKLQLTLEDFMNAKEYSDPFNCPISTGIKRLYPDIPGISCSYRGCSMGGSHYSEVTEYACYDEIAPLIVSVKKGQETEFPKLIFRKYEQ